MTDNLEVMDNQVQMVYLGILVMMVSKEHLVKMGLMVLQGTEELMVNLD